MSSPLGDEYVTGSGVNLSVAASPCLDRGWGEQWNDGKKKRERGQIHERKATWMEEKSDGQAVRRGGVKVAMKG